MLTTDLLHELRSKARDVTDPRPEQVMARDAARRLHPMVSGLARLHGMEAMRHACAVLARGERPGSEVERLLAASIMPAVALCGDSAARAALAFWASECDPAVWRDVVAA